MNFHESRTAWETDRAHFETRGAVLPDVISYLPDEFRTNYTLAMDAMPMLATAPNSGIPSMLTTMIDPAVFKVLFAPTRAAEIFGEVRKGTWLDETAMFPTVEHTGEVSSYGDYSENGHTGVNANWPQRQAYLFQTVKEYGERELERAGLARLNWVSEIDRAAATILNRFANLTYFFGVLGLQNYGLFNDPNLKPSLTPAIKAAGGVGWFNGTAPNATANEVYNDILAIFETLVNQTAGLVDRETKMVLALSPASEVALGFVNVYGLVTRKMLADEFPNLRIESAVQYGALSASNPQGIAAGNFVQLIAEEVEGQDTGYCSFNEKMRAGTIVKQLSSFRQKVVAGTWGAIIRQPFAIASMVGV